MKNRLFVVLALIVVVVGFFLVKRVVDSKNSNPVVASETPAAPMGSFTRPHSPSLGNMMAQVTVVEWFDPECESCRAIHPVLNQIIKEYGNRVRFVFRYMPYHPSSMFASSAIEEAQELGKFEEALDILFEKQPEWGDHHEPKPELIPTYLAKLGIPKEKLDKDYLIQKHGEKIKQDESDGLGVGVQGTPTFFVNGRVVYELGDKPLRAAIEAALEN
ncbi:MAG: DsbA family protein [Proteobacteria bacterium]|nr:MAG: DsbA family protein [Pseudomonadota bacterium]